MDFHSSMSLTVRYIGVVRWYQSFRLNTEAIFWWLITIRSAGQEEGLWCTKSGFVMEP